ncbi:winged helix DNA-binding protein [Novosphingobium taihuense]|uniref:DNA-binding MarR family transcriptional regulator n=1 Tax=Novosphingobium taihuense TaxID=260085 RepID=A0A7W7A8X5_9SPHN|nr:winged helix DNA-binding protein [Novosphingobium taihuense]MBB4612456.1 hypothetical protein [Novosphingobium taihuense]TWH88192.1 hypothetical protein IQ25_00307 [Novosphingobium taihuense]
MNKEELARLAAIQTLIGELLGHHEEVHGETVPTFERLAAIAKAKIQARRRRQELFPGIQVADPAWDLMLELFIHHVEMRQISVTGLGLGANIPGATVLRWLAIFHEAGLIVREPDPSDRRRVWVRLTQSGAERIAMAISPGNAISSLPAARTVERSTLAA